MKHTSNSLATLYDARDEIAVATKNIIDSIPFFKRYTDKERDILGKNSSNLFTLNMIYKAKDFLIDCLSAYIHSNEYLERTEEFENIFSAEASPFEVTYAFELQITNYGNEKIPLHFLMVKAKCDYAFDGRFYDGMEMLVDYDTGMVYNKFNVDESWMAKGNKSEAICVAAVMGGFCDSRYNGEPIFNDSEVHIQFSESDIAEINQALGK